MKQLRQMQQELEGVQHRLIYMLAKFAMAFTGFVFVLCWFSRIKRLLDFTIVAVFILCIGLYLFKNWYTRYKSLRAYFFTLEKEYKRRTNEHIKEVQRAIDGLLFIRRF